MFGIGGSEIIVILIVALLFLGPDKLPEAAKQISKGIRDIKKQTRVLTQSIEDDEVVGGAIRDLKSALRGEEISIRPKPFKPLKRPELATVVTVAAGDADPALEALEAPVPAEEGAIDTLEPATGEPSQLAALPLITLPPSAGERDPDVTVDDADDDASLAALIRPAAGTVAKGQAIDATDEEPHASGDSERKHG